jgi:hypothetical protein
LSQADGIYLSPEAFMSTAAFQRGFAEGRCLLRPRFDDDDVLVDPYAYEAGRQFAILAPPDLELVVRQGINPDAIQLLGTLVDTGAICV